MLVGVVQNRLTVSLGCAKRCRDSHKTPRSPWRGGFHDSPTQAQDPFRPRRHAVLWSNRRPSPGIPPRSRNRGS